MRSEGRIINNLDSIFSPLCKEQYQIVIVNDFCRIFSLTLPATVFYLQLGPSLVQMGSGETSCLGKPRNTDRKGNERQQRAEPGDPNPFIWIYLIYWIYLT